VKECSKKEQLKKNFDQRHKAQPLTLLQEGATVWILDHNCVGKVINKVGPCSYQVETKLGMLRCNCHHLITLPDKAAGVDTDIDVIPDLPNSSHSITNGEPEPPPQHRAIYTTSGRVSRPPNHFIPDD